MIILVSIFVFVIFLSVFWLRFKGLTVFKWADLGLKDKVLFILGLPGAAIIFILILPFMLVENVIRLFNIMIKQKIGVNIVTN